MPAPPKFGRVFAARVICGMLQPTREGNMDAIQEVTRLPADIDAEPLVRAAAAMRPLLRAFQPAVERDQRFPPALVGQLHEAGFYRMTIPRVLGGLEADTLSFLRVVELMAEGLGSVGWNLVNNGVIQLISIGLPDDGVDEIYGNGKGTVIAGTAIDAVGAR